MKIIELNKVNFSYGVNQDGFRIKDVDLEINRGDFISVMGPNGSGKSTIIKLISGVLYPSGGKVLLENRPIASYRRKEIARKIAFVPQSTGNAYPFSVFEIVMMGRSPYLNLWGNEKPEDVEIVKHALNLVGIYHLKDKGINEISGGEAQRAYIARAFAQKTELILLDEPNSHLDIEHQISIFRLLREFNEKEGTTIVTISHDLNLSATFSKSGVVMKDGELVISGNVENVLTVENIRDIFNVDSEVKIHDNKLSVSILAS